MENNLKWIIELRDYEDADGSCFRIEFTEEREFHQFVTKFLDCGFSITTFMES